MDSEGPETRGGDSCGEEKTERLLPGAVESPYSMIASDVVIHLCERVRDRERASEMERRRVVGRGREEAREEGKQEGEPMCVCVRVCVCVCVCVCKRARV